MFDTFHPLHLTDNQFLTLLISKTMNPITSTRNIRNDVANAIAKYMLSQIHNSIINN